MIEHLETRRLLHGQIVDGVLVFFGTQTHDAISFTLRNNQIRALSNDGFAQDFPLKQVNSISVELFAGNDRVEVAPEITRRLTADGGDGKDTIRGGGGRDNLLGGAGNDLLDGRKGNDNLKGDGGSDLLKGAAGRDALTGGDGNDTLDGGAGPDTMAGGLGADWADYRARKRRVTVTLAGNQANDGEANERDTIVVDVENVFGSSAGDHITGSARSNRIEGRAGNDSLFGGARQDTLFGGDGNDRMMGQDGRDQLLGGMGDDRLDGNLGPDTLTGEQGNDALFAKDGDKDFVHGGEGTDTAELDDLDLQAAIP